jgi:diguanylate cyclase (GGDEF)-like protein
VLHATAAQPFSAPAAADLAGVADFAGRALRAVGAGGPSAPAAAAVHPAGLLDRRGFADGFARARTEVPRVAVAVAELDGLGVLDGTLGPDMVERCLRLLADVLRSSLRDRDLVGRLDGDGIVMAFPGCRLDDARRALDAVRGRLDAAVTVAGVAPFTASFGVVETGEREDPTTVVGRATAALVEARRAGGDRVVVHDAAGRVKEAPQDGWGPNHDVLTRQRRDFTPGTAIRPADDALPQILPDPPADGPHPTDPDGGPGER